MNTDVTKYFAYLTYEYEPVKVMQGNILIVTIGENINKIHACLDTLEDIKHRKKYTMCGFVHRDNDMKHFSLYKFNLFPEELTIVNIFQRLEFYEAKDFSGDEFYSLDLMLDNEQEQQKLKNTTIDSIEDFSGTYNGNKLKTKIVLNPEFYKTYKKPFLYSEINEDINPIRMTLYKI
jgi:hypothetical protein